MYRMVFTSSGQKCVVYHFTDNGTAYVSIDGETLEEVNISLLKPIQEQTTLNE